MTPRSPQPRRAITLLEAVIALGLIALLAAAVIQARSAAITESTRLEHIQRTNREIQSLTTALLNGALPQPTRTQTDTPNQPPIPVWTGTHLDHPYTITRTVTTLPNPIAQTNTSDDDPTTPSTPDSIALFQYTIEYRGETHTFTNHR